MPDLEEQLAAELQGASWAIVAFAPKDAAWCDWLYRNLNGYPLPVSLVGRVTSQGVPRPDCLSIFPDLRDPGYADHTARAVESSTYLIVVCSPHSAGLEEVDDQIRAFKKAGGEERVLALVVDGPPDARLGEFRRAAECDWLPSWLRWRLEEEGFRAADREEPRVIDARRGYRSLKQVRDSLLSALAETDGAELEQLGACERGVEIQPLPEIPPSERIPAMTTDENNLPSLAGSPRSSRYTICTAVLLIVVAVVFGWRSIREITADEPVSTLEVSPVSGVVTHRVAKTKLVDEAVASPDTVASTPDAVPEPVPLESKPPTASREPEVKAPEIPAAVAAPVAVALPNMPQVVPPSVWAMSKILPIVAQTAPGSGLGVATVPHIGASYYASGNVAGSPETDAALLDEVRTLEQHADRTMSEKRTEDALDLYLTALSSAEEYAARKGANSNAHDQVVALMRKLGTLQMQNSSTAEARATYLQARRSLLQLKSQGQWSRERAKTLDEIESRLLSLPRY